MTVSTGISEFDCPSSCPAPICTQTSGSLGDVAAQKGWSRCVCVCARVCVGSGPVIVYPFTVCYMRCEELHGGGVGVGTVFGVQWENTFLLRF